MSNLRKDIVYGSLYIGIAKYSGILFQIVVSAILARLLLPEDFGVVAIASIIIAFFGLLSDVGISSAIVQKKELNSDDFNHIFSFTIYLGVLLGGAFFCMARPISILYDNQLLLTVCQIMSLLLFLACSQIVPSGLLMRNKEFKYKSFSTLFTNVIGGIIACIAAYWGLGVYSLILASLIPSVIIFILFYNKHPLKFYLKFSIKPIKHIFSYSIYVFLFNVVNYFSRNLDKLLVGKYISMADLGQYQKSYQLMMMPLNNISDVITPVLHPVFSDYQNDLSFIKQKYFKFLHLVAYISFPLSVFLYYIASEAILIVYGDKWGPAVRPFQILSLTVSTQMLLSSTGSIYQAINATKPFFIAGCLCALFMVSGFAFSIHGWGTIVAISWGFFFAHLLNVLSSFWILGYILKANIEEFMMIIMRPILFSIIIAVVFIIQSHWPVGNIIVSLFIKTIIFGLSLLFLMEFFSEYRVISFCLVYVKNKIKKQ